MQLFIQAMCFVYLLSSCSYLTILAPIAEEVVEDIIEEIIESEAKD